MASEKLSNQSVNGSALRIGGRSDPAPASVHAGQIISLSRRGGRVRCWRGSRGRASALPFPAVLAKRGDGSLNEVSGPKIAPHWPEWAGCAVRPRIPCSQLVALRLGCRWFGVTVTWPALIPILLTPGLGHREWQESGSGGLGNRTRSEIADRHWQPRTCSYPVVARASCRPLPTNCVAVPSRPATVRQKRSGAGGTEPEISCCRA